MAAPNLKDPAFIRGEPIRYAVTTTLTAFLTNNTNSNKLFRVACLYAANVDGVVNADITLTHFDGTTDIHLARTIIVPADATQLLITREAIVYVKEGQSLRAQASANGDIELFGSYEDIS